MKSGLDPELELVFISMTASALKVKKMEMKKEEFISLAHEVWKTIEVYGEKSIEEIIKKRFPEVKQEINGKKKA